MFRKRFAKADSDEVGRDVKLSTQLCGAEIELFSKVNLSYEILWHILCIPPVH